MRISDWSSDVCSSDLFVIDTTTLVLAALTGLLAGFLAAGLSSALYRIEDGFHALPDHWMWWPALGAVVVGIGGNIDPRLSTDERCVRKDCVSQCWSRWSSDSYKQNSISIRTQLSHF